MPHVLLLSAFLTPFRSGAEACVEEMPVFLRDRFAFTIVTARLKRSLPREDVLNGIPVLRVGLGLSIDKWLFPFLAAFTVRRLQPEIVHAVLESFAGFALVLCRWIAPAPKRVLTCQSTNTRLLLGPIHRAAHRITAISSVLVERAGRLGRQDVTLIPNGIRFQDIRAAVTATRKVPGRILFVGRLEPMKGVDTLLAAIRLLIETPAGKAAAVSLHIVGDGSCAKALRGEGFFLTERGIARFLGRLDHAALYREYAEAQMFCGLSRSEALGNVFLEAEAAGCAVVATNVGGIPDIVQDGRTGLLVPVNQPEAAAQAIERLLADDVLRNSLAEAAAAHAAGYEWREIAERYGEVYGGIKN